MSLLQSDYGADSRNRILKKIATALFYVLSAPIALPVRWSRRLDSEDRIFQFGSHAVSLIPGIVGVYFRRGYYGTVLAHFGSDVVIEFGTILGQRSTDIGNRVYIGAFCNIGMSRIEDDVLVGSNVDIVSGQRIHRFDRTDRPIREQATKFEKISIGKGVWIGNRSVLMAEVGPHAIVGAGSIVTRPCDAYGIYAGNPARLIRDRREDTQEKSIDSH